MEKILEIGVQYGLPTVLLILTVMFFIKPVFNAFLANIEKQTEVNDTILRNCMEMKNDISSIKNKLNL